MNCQDRACVCSSEGQKRREDYEWGQRALAEWKQCVHGLENSEEEACQFTQLCRWFQLRVQQGFPTDVKLLSFIWNRPEGTFSDLEKEKVEWLPLLSRGYSAYHATLVPRTPQSGRGTEAWVHRTGSKTQKEIQTFMSAGIFHRHLCERHLSSLLFLLLW